MTFLTGLTPQERREFSAMLGRLLKPEPDESIKVPFATICFVSQGAKALLTCEPRLGMAMQFATEPDHYTITGLRPSVRLEGWHRIEARRVGGGKRYSFYGRLPREDETWEADA